VLLTHPKGPLYLLVSLLITKNGQYVKLSLFLHQQHILILLSSRRVCARPLLTTVGSLPDPFLCLLSHPPVLPL
jgi:hypothetical protein